MIRRSIIAVTVVIVALLALVKPVLAGGWAVVTLDTLPRDVRAGQPLHLGFMVRQHGRTPTNTDLNGKPLQPVLTARKQGPATSQRRSATLALVAARTSVQAKGEETIRVEPRQAGAVGHYSADVTFPSDGVWAWQIEIPTYYVQNGATGQDGHAAIFAPLTVLPASTPAPAPAVPPATNAGVPSPIATTILGLSPLTLRWSGAILLLLAAGIALYGRRATLGRRLERSR
jgi:hypothetical protein